MLTYKESSTKTNRHNRQVRDKKSTMKEGIQHFAEHTELCYLGVTHSEMMTSTRNMASDQLWLKTTEMYYPAILEGRMQQSRCWQSHAPSEGSREKSFFAPLPGLWWLPAILGLQQSNSTPTSAYLPCVCIQNFLLLLRTAGLGPAILQYDLNLTKLHL